jgi:hypothetical protein
MRASEAVSRIPHEVTQAFMSRLPAALRDRVSLLQNPTDELVSELADAKASGKGWGDVALFAQGVRSRRMMRPSGNGSGKARLEENYFYSSRRFPALTNNTIGGGALPKGDFPFFVKGVNDDGVSMGFPTGFTLDVPETNMEGSGGTIAQGTNFVFNQLGISFNSDIAVHDLAVMLDAVALTFAKGGGQFSLSHGPLKMWPAGMGISGFAAMAEAFDGTGVDSISAVTNGSPDLRQIRHLRIPRILRERETFKYNFTVARPTKAKDGSTIALSAFVVATIWLFGGQKNLIPT